MAMDEKTSRLMSQLKDRMIEVSDDQITEIIREARDEALAEAKALIKDMMVRSILERALGELEGVGRSAVLAGEAVSGSTEASTVRSAEALAEVSAEPLETAQAQDMAESKEQVWQEIEAIRTKIAENERLLSQMRSSDTEAEAVPASSVEPVLSEVEGAEVRAAPGEGMMGEDYGYYVYAIVRSDASQPEGLPEEGIDPIHPVYALQPSAISHQLSAISAIVSRVSLQEFSQEALESNLEDIKWVEAKVLAHQRVLEAVLASRTLIPMRFCTIYQSEGRVQEMLAQHYDDFVTNLAQLEGKQEWGIKVYCDDKALVQRVGETSDKVKELKAEMEQKSSGAAYFLKKKMDEAIAEEVERASDEYAQHSHDRLSSHAEEAVINPLQSKELTGRKEAMVLNGAYLVAEEQLAAFRAELESLAEEYGGLGLIYEMTGPWPPYNFVSVGLEESAADE
jgi:hypothetical protein